LIKKQKYVLTVARNNGGKLKFIITTLFILVFISTLSQAINSPDSNKNDSPKLTTNQVQNDSTTKPTAEPTSEPTSEPAKEETPKLTMGQKNALSKAESYLNYSAFSYSGLIKQLEFEEFSNEDATYAVYNCGANWNEQAAKKNKHI
jgi:hypothetical protein